MSVFCLSCNRYATQEYMADNANFLGVVAKGVTRQDRDFGLLMYVLDTRKNRWTKSTTLHAIGTTSDIATISVLFGYILVYLIQNEFQSRVEFGNVAHFEFGAISQKGHHITISK